MNRYTKIRQLMCTASAVLLAATLCGCLNVFDQIEDYVPEDLPNASDYIEEIPTTEATDPSTVIAPTSSVDTTEPTSSPQNHTFWGVVTVKDLNIRSGPGTDYDSVGSLKKGDRIEILEQQQVGTSTWGKTVLGWISMRYVSPEINDTDENAPSQTDPSASNDTVIGTITCDVLNIREGAGTDYDVVGTLKRGDRVEILAQVNVNGALWGKITKGWITMKYVSANSSAPEVNEPDYSIDSSIGVVTTKVLNIRKGAGTNYKSVGTLSRGDKVEILEEKTVKGVRWGRINQGWISLEYVSFNTVSAQVDPAIVGNWVHATPITQFDSGDRYTRAGVYDLNADGTFNHYVRSYLKNASNRWQSAGQDEGGVEEVNWKGTFSFDGTKLVLVYSTGARVTMTVSISQNSFTVDDPGVIPLYSDFSAGEDSTMNTLYRASAPSEPAVYTVLDSIYP